MVKVMYNDHLVYKLVIRAFFGISLWKEKVALKMVWFSNVYIWLAQLTAVGRSYLCTTYRISLA